ncbi:hypothetical protein [Caenispirillum salinarum]|uniref:hypothetical protein n=1 Tax=Caenispirillum salinarum TaxID=859058 RepID=UPI00384F0075
MKDKVTVRGREPHAAHREIAEALHWLHRQAVEARLPAGSVTAIREAAELCTHAPAVADEEAKGRLMCLI